jgi:hypothetical protein
MGKCDIMAKWERVVGKSEIDFHLLGGSASIASLGECLSRRLGRRRRRGLLEEEAGCGGRICTAHGWGEHDVLAQLLEELHAAR